MMTMPPVPGSFEHTLEWSAVAAKRARKEPLTAHEQEVYQRGQHTALVREELLWQELGCVGSQPLQGEQSDADLLAQVFAALPAEMSASGAVAPAATFAAEIPKDVSGTSKLPTRPRYLSSLAWAAGLAASLLCAITFAAYQLWPALSPSTPAHELSSISHHVQASGRASKALAYAAARATDDQVFKQKLYAVSYNFDSLGALETKDKAPQAPGSFLAKSSSPNQVEQTPRAALAKDANALLHDAQEHLAAGNRTQAMADYRALQQAFPQSPEARISHVSLGKLQLASGRGEQALREFAAYLQGGSGDLVEEALHGRVLALRQLGRLLDERAAILDFLQRYPRSAHTSALQKRLADMPTP